jgi:hypothetical protein
MAPPRTPAVPPVPVDRELVPPFAPSAPPDALLVNSRLSGGLPERLPLEADRAVTLVAPTGNAHAWREADPTDVFATAVDQLAPHTKVEENAAGRLVPVRLLFDEGGRTRAAIPLVVGRSALLPGAEPDTVRDEVRALDWVLRSGNQVGVGDVGSSLRIAWRRADRASDAFAQPVVHPRVLPRLLAELEPAKRVESSRVDPFGEWRVARWLYRRPRFLPLRTKEIR